VTWHLQSCPHYAADRILAGQKAERSNGPWRGIGAVFVGDNVLEDCDPRWSSLWGQRLPDFGLERDWAARYALASERAVDRRPSAGSGLRSAPSGYGVPTASDHPGRTGEGRSGGR
jgi:hypothetical protein